MLSTGLWRWYINITITILANIHRPVFSCSKLTSTLQVCPYLRGNTLCLRYVPNRVMLSIGLWRWYSNTTITILGIIHRPVFYLRHDASETGFCLHLQKALIEAASHRLRTPVCFCLRRQRLALSTGPTWVGCHFHSATKKGMLHIN
jgi:hypothetical protein